MQIFTQGCNRRLAPQLRALLTPVSSVIFLVLLYVLWLFGSTVQPVPTCLCTVDSRYVELWCLSDFTELNIGG